MTARTLTWLARLAALALAAVILAWPPAASPGRATGATAVAAGGAHTCALGSSGALKCWGKNDIGEVGDGSLTERHTPVNTSGLSTGVLAVSTGGDHSCAVRTGGGLRCWGFNRYGQLGNGSTALSDHPVDVSGLTSGVAGVAGGLSHTCAVTTGGAAKCWGRNDLGQLGATSSGSCQALACSLTPLDVTGLSSGVASMAAGDGHTCALTTGGGVKCWGSNNSGQLGDGTQMNRPAPVDVSGLTSGVSAIAAGTFHSCALTTGGGVKCWGGNSFGELGDTTTEFRTAPVDVSGLTSGVIAIAGGAFHTCALTSTGGVKCWGRNDLGQLGAASSDSCVVFSDVYACSLTPLDVTGLTSGVSAIGGGGSNFHTCAVLGGTLRCWGYNQRGQIGDGTTTNAETPQPVFGFGPAPDSDLDGCVNTREVLSNPLYGGARDPKNFWDFFDTPNASNVRDLAVTAADVARVVQRFGRSGDAGIDPLSPPPPPPAYHTAFDRMSGGTGPNGSLTVQDIALVVVQFGHTCA